MAEKKREERISYDPRFQKYLGRILLPPKGRRPRKTKTGPRKQGA